jgi:hypothetical protein
LERCLKSFEEASQFSHWQTHRAQLSTCVALMWVWSAEGSEKAARQRRPGACCHLQTQDWEASSDSSSPVLLVDCIPGLGSSRAADMLKSIFELFGPALWNASE